MLLGIPGDNTYSNYQEANRTFWRQTVLPLVQRTTGALAEWLGPVYGNNLTLRPDLDDIPALSTEQDALWARLEKSTFLTDDEKRAAVGYCPKPATSTTKLFSPGQLRKPPGQPGGGRWTKPDDGGSSNTGSDGSSDGASGDASSADNADHIDNNDLAADQTPPISDNSEKPQPVAERGRYNVDLVAEEQRGGHAIREHVGQTDAQLVGVLRENTTQYDLGPLRVTRGKLAEGSFDSIEQANDLVNRSLEIHKDQVDRVATGQSDQEVLQTRFGYPTGKEAWRAYAKDDPIIRNTYGTIVVLSPDARAPNGYTVKTAYPWNRNPN